MTKEEIAKLLAVAAELDPRVTVTVPKVEAWHSILGDMDAESAWAAVREHYRTSDAVLMPVHVVDGVAALLRARAWDTPVLTPEEAQLCAAAGVPAEEFVERRDDADWIAHLKSKWLGVES